MIDHRLLVPLLCLDDLTAHAPIEPDAAGGTEFLMGLCIFTMCATEAPLFHFAGPIFDFVGLSLTLHIVMGVYVFRLCLYGSMALAGTPWAVLPIEMLHGVTFGCAWAAGTLNCARIAPRGLEATTQAIFNVRALSSGLHSSSDIMSLNSHA